MGTRIHTVAGLWLLVSICVGAEVLTEGWPSTSVSHWQTPVSPDKGSAISELIFPVFCMKCDLIGGLCSELKFPARNLFSRVPQTKVFGRIFCVTKTCYFTCLSENKCNL